MTSTAGIRSVTLALLAVVSSASIAEARPRAGSIDRSFGQNGSVVVNLPGERMHLRAMTVQPDGAILLGGSLGDSDTYPYQTAGCAVVVRLRRDGRLDESFGSAGVARVRLPLPVAIAGIALQPDGAVLLSGVALQPDARNDLAALVRLSPTGVLDEAFGAQGLATVEAENIMPPHARQAYPLTEIGVHPDDRILAAGSQRAYDVHDPSDPLMVRFLANGTPDPSFDGNGAAKIGGQHQTAILPQPDGALVALGWHDYYFGQSAVTAVRVPPAAIDFPVPAPLPSNVFSGYEWNRGITGLAARAEPDGSILYTGQLRPNGDRRFVAWVRIGPDLELLGRGKRFAPAGTVGTLDSREALLTAEATPTAGLVDVRRFRGSRFRTDGSFGWPAREPELRDPVELVGMEMQGRNKVLLAAFSEYNGPYPQLPPGDEPLTLFRLHAHQDGRGPIIILRGLPRRGRCADGTLEPLVRIRDESRVRAAVRLDHRTLSMRRRKRFRVEIDTTKLRPGSHKLVVSARDAAGNLSRFGMSFRVCARG